MLPSRDQVKMLRMRASSLDLERIPLQESADRDKRRKSKKLWRIHLPFVWGLWALAFWLGEVAVSRMAVRTCDWANADPREYRLAVVADPQLTDFYSYNMEKGSWTLALTEFYSDLYMRRHFQLLANKPQAPHGVLFLGDLFDGGRLLNMAEHNAHMRRFEWIFGGHDGIQFWNMSGNHDVGIKKWNNDRANQLQRERFGLTQYSVVLGHVEVVVIDSIGMLSNDPEVRSSAINFVRVYGSMKAKRQFPRILFTHIPLYRPSNSDCGPRRQKAPIGPGEGVSYQNVLSKELSDMILEAVDPIHVFSGDDHTPCTYVHKAHNVTEDTLATFSWLQGERHPEFTMLSLQGSLTNATPMHIETCSLPDQMLIYFIYAALGIATVVYLACGDLPPWKHSTAVKYAIIVCPVLLWYGIVLVVSIIFI